MATIFEPGGEIFALADIKELQLITAICYGFDANASDSDTSTDGEVFEKEKMETNAAQ